jgi:predicted peroxiredoxin
VEFGEDLSAGVCEGTLAESRAQPGGAMRTEERMKFVYVVTTGTDDPTKASLPLHLAANGSVEVGHDTAVLLAGDATEILFGDNLEQMQGIGVPPVRELIAKLRDHSVPVYV